MKTASLLPPTLAMISALAFPTTDTRAEIGEATWRGQAITSFTPEENEVLDWQIVNDGVMGGLSEGRIEFTSDNTMKFFGDLSLKNNGGFTTARSAAIDLDLSNDLGLLLKVKGDGRTYQARLDADARFRGAPVSFAGEFSTRKGEWQQIKIPFSAFKGSFRGTDLPDARLNPAAIERVWILLGDKKEGPFSLEIEWIQTYGKGQGQFAEEQAKPGEKIAKRPQENEKSQSLIDTMLADGRFTVLKTALDRAGLTTFFQWDNKLTVFAPTDEAFKELPPGMLESLLRPDNKAQLIELLSYHVAAGENSLADLLSSQEVEAVKGGSLEIAFGDGRVRVNQSALIDADVVCTDGVIHVLDTVLLPSEES